jgi:hypothetical protein
MRSVDEPPTRRVRRRGSTTGAASPALEGLARELAHGDVAVVLMEPLSAALSAALSGRTDLDLVDVGGPDAARRAIGGRAAPVATARVGSDFCHEYPCVTHRAS